MTILSRLKHWLRPGACREPVDRDTERFRRLSADVPATFPAGYRAPLDTRTSRELIAERDTKAPEPGPSAYLRPKAERCPKCRAFSGDDWKQCNGACPMPGSPHYSHRSAWQDAPVAPPRSREEVAKLRATIADRAADPAYQPPKPWPKSARQVPMPKPGIDPVQPTHAELYGAPWDVSAAVAEGEARASIERDDIWPAAAAVGLAVAIAATADDSGGGEGGGGGAGASGSWDAPASGGCE